MPRTVPRRRFQETLDCTKAAGRPWAWNSSTHTERAKNPRSSQWRSIFTSAAPESSRVSNSMSAPVELVVDLPGRLQVHQLLNTGEGAELVRFGRHLNTLEQLTQLPRPITRGVLALEARQFAVDALEVDAVTAVVAAGRADRNCAAGKLVRDDLRQLPDPVVLRVLSHVEDLAAHRVLWRHETAIDGLADVLDMHNRAPGTAVARHGDALGRPRQRAQIIDHDIEAHARRRTERGGIAQEHGGEIGARHRQQVTLHQHLAFGVSALRVDARVLVQKIPAPRAIDAARRGVDEAPDAGAHTLLCEGYRALMVDLVCHFGVVLSERIVG